MARLVVYKGFKLALELRAEGLAAANPQSFYPYFLIRRAHGKVRTQEGWMDVPQPKVGEYHGNPDRSSAVYDGISIHGINTLEPKWPRVEIDVEKLCEDGDISKKIVVEVWDYATNQFLGFLLASIDDFFLYNEFPLLSSTKSHAGSSKIFVKAELVPPGPCVPIDHDSAKKICGVLLYQASTGTTGNYTEMDEVEIAGKAAGGWAYFETVADKSGNIDLPTLEKIVKACLKQLLTSYEFHFSEVINYILNFIVSPLLGSFSEQAKTQFNQDLVNGLKRFDSAEKLSPLVARFLFRYFDTDASGTIRKEEVYASMLLFKELSATAMSKPTLERIYPVVDAFFGIYDSGTGYVDTLKLQDIGLGLVSGFATLLTCTVDTVKIFATDEFLGKLVVSFCDGLQNSTGSYWPIDTENFVQICMKNYVDPTHQAFDQFRAILHGQLQHFVPGLQLEPAFDVLDFFQRFEKQAVDGKLKKDRCADIASICIRLEGKGHNVDSLRKVLDQRVSDANAQFLQSFAMKNAGVSLTIKNELVHEIVQIASFNAQAFIRSGGGKRFALAVLDLLDLNNDGIMSRAEVRNFYDTFTAVLENGVNAELKQKIIKAVLSFLNLLDSDSNNILSRPEVASFSKKVMEALFSLLTFLIAALKSTLASVVPSIVNLALDLKGQFVGGDISGVTRNEIGALFSKLEAITHFRRSDLHWESVRGNADMVLDHLRKGQAQVEGKDEEGKTSLHLAAQYSRLDVVRTLIECRADVGALVENFTALDISELNSSDWSTSSRLWEHKAVKEILKGAGCNGWTAIMLAAERGDAAGLQQQIGNRGDVHARTKEGRTALHVAKNRAIVTQLLASRAELEARDCIHQTPLHVSVSKGNSEAVSALLENRANMYQIDAFSRRPIDCAGSNKAVAAVLKNAGMDGWNPMMVAAESGNFAQVNSLATQYPVATPKHDGKTALHIAAMQPASVGQKEVIKGLLQLRADLNAKDHDKNTPLALAADAETSDYLKSLGAEGWTEVMVAAHRGNSEVIKGLVTKRADVNAKRPDNRTALHYAAEGSHVGAVQALIEAKADVSAVFILKRVEKGLDENFSVLDVAKGDPVINALRRAGADKWTELMVAAAENNHARVRELLQNKAPPNAQDKVGNTALHHAMTTSADIQTIRALLDGKADPNLRNSSNSTPYSLKYCHRHFTSEIDMLFKTCGADGWTQLMITSEKGDVQRLTALIQQGQNVNQRNAAQLTALHYAGRQEVVECLLNAKADIEARGSHQETALDTVQSEDAKDALRLRGLEGWTRLMVFSRQRNVQAVNDILGSQRENPNATDKHSENALHKIAAEKFSPNTRPIVDSLFRAKANINQANKLGRTPLDVAVDEDTKDVLRIYGACGWNALMVAVRKGDLRETSGLVGQVDVNAVNSEQMTALHIAVNQKVENVDIIRTLLSAHASPNVLFKGSTPLHLAVSLGHANTAKLLLEARADLEARNSTSQTALAVAAVGNKTECVKLLIDSGASVEAKDSHGRIPERSSYYIAEDIKYLLRHRRINGWPSLLASAEEGDEEAVQRLIQNRSNVNEKIRDNRSALHVASLANTGIIRILLAAKADISAQSNLGTPLEIAIEKQETAGWWESISKDAIELLKLSGADNWTPVMVAAEKGRDDQLRALIYQGQSAQAITKQGETALHCACRASAVMDKNTFLRTMKLLLDAKVDIDLVNSHRQSALDVAIAGVAKNAANESKVEVLKRAGAGGWTPLMVAANVGDDGTVKNLIDAGVDVFVQNKEGKSAIDVAKDWSVDILSEAMFKAMRVDSYLKRVEHASPGSVIVSPLDSTITWKSMATVAFPAASAVRRGQAYYEIEVLALDSYSACTLGWATAGVNTSAGSGVGDDTKSWGADGVKPGRRGKDHSNALRVGDRVQAQRGNGYMQATVATINQDNTVVVHWDDNNPQERLKQIQQLQKLEATSNLSPFGTKWRVGDIIGVAMVSNDQTTTLYTACNGSFDPPNGQMFTLENARVPDGLFPALTAASGVKLRYNFGDTPFKFSPNGFQGYVQLQQRIPPSPEFTNVVAVKTVRLTVRGLRNDDAAAHVGGKCVELSNVLFFGQHKLVRGSAMSPNGKSPVGEGPENISGEYKSQAKSGGGKWVDYNITSPLIIDFGHHVHIDSYTLVTGSGGQERDPVTWLLEGTADGASWTTLDSRDRSTAPLLRGAQYATFGFDKVPQACSLRSAHPVALPTSIGRGGMGGLPSAIPTNSMHHAPTIVSSIRAGAIPTSPAGPGAYGQPTVSSYGSQNQTYGQPVQPAVSSYGSQNQSYGQVPPSVATGGYAPQGQAHPSVSSGGFAHAGDHLNPGLVSSINPHAYASPGSYGGAPQGQSYAAAPLLGQQSFPAAAPPPPPPAPVQPYGRR